MELHRALSQLSEIHAQVLRSEVFRGYRSVPMAVTGVLALAAAALQERLWPPADGTAFVWFWFGVACLAVAIHGADVLFALRRQDARAFHKHTLPVLLQFVPTLVVGAAVTAVFALRTWGAAAFLPGLWALVFALGVFASRPYLPRAVGWVATFYLIAGIALLVAAEPGVLPSSWSMGLTFGVGQLAFATVMHLKLERRRDG